MPSRQAAPAAPGLAALFTAVSKGGVAGERCAKQLWNTVECGLDGGVDDQLLECASRLLIQSGVRFELTSPQRCCLPSAPGPNSPPPPPPPRRRRCPSSAAAASWAPWPSTCRPAARPAPPSWRRWCSTWPPGCRRRTKWFASGRASCWPTSCSPCTRMPSCHRCARAGRGWAGSPGLSPAAAQDAAGAAGGQGSRAATCHRPTPLPPPPPPTPADAAGRGRGPADRAPGGQGHGREGAGCTRPGPAVRPRRGWRLLPGPSGCSAHGPAGG
jgi:hypothetical protein